MERKVTQKGTVYPTILNIVVDAVVQYAFLEVYEPQESHHEMGWAAGEQDIFLMTMMDTSLEETPSGGRVC